MYKLYAFATPNSIKPLIAMEELNLEYEIHSINVKKGEQKSSGFLTVNPNAKVPVLASLNNGEGMMLSESAAILIYLAEQHGALLPTEGIARARVFEQLFFHASGLSPAFGQAGYFQKLAPEVLPAAIQRFHGEALRTMTVLDGTLAKNVYVAGDEYSIADIAHFGWIWRRAFAGIDLEAFPNVMRWFELVAQRPAVMRAIAKIEALVPTACSISNTPFSLITLNHTMKSLFSSIQIGPYTLKHRVVMAPLTRMRSSIGDIPNDLMAEYYSQRATDGGLIISEATPVSLYGRAYAGAPNILNQEQVDGWKKITSAVHAKGGRIFLQLWHVGRQSHPSLQPDGGTPLAPSAIQAEGHAYAADGPVEFSMPRALKLDEIPGIVEEFRLGAERALKAGFDGVELHGANGYLPDQFLQDGSNRRDDSYGGSIANRSRFFLEVTAALVSVWGKGRVGVRISPSGTYGSMYDSNPQATFGYLVEQLNQFNLAYLHVVEPRIKGTETIDEQAEPVAVRHLRSIFKGPLIAAGGFDRLSAENLLASGDADMVAFGRHFISNPDLPRRLRDDIPLNKYDRDTFYGGDARGYTDYTFASEDR